MVDGGGGGAGGGGRSSSSSSGWLHGGLQALCYRTRLLNNRNVEVYKEKNAFKLRKISSPTCITEIPSLVYYAVILINLSFPFSSKSIAHCIIQSIKHIRWTLRLLGQHFIVYSETYVLPQSVIIHNCLYKAINEVLIHFGVKRHRTDMNCCEGHAVIQPNCCRLNPSD